MMKLLFLILTQIVKSQFFDPNCYRLSNVFGDNNSATVLDLPVILNKTYMDLQLVYIHTCSN